jgi:hypothetical protein
MKLWGGCARRTRHGGAEIIITGSVVAPLVIEPDKDTMAFELDPVGRVGVCLSNRWSERSVPERSEQAACTDRPLGP